MGPSFRRPTVLTSDLIPSPTDAHANYASLASQQSVVPVESPSSPSHQPPPGHQATRRGIQPGSPSWTVPAWMSLCFGRKGPSIFTICSPISSQHLEHVTKLPTHHHLAFWPKTPSRNAHIRGKFRTYGDGEVIPSLLGSGGS